MIVCAVLSLHSFSARASSLLFDAVASGNIEECIYLLDSESAHIDELDTDGKNALHHAAINAQLEIAELLIDRGIDSQKADDEGKLPIDYAYKHANLRVIKTILKASPYNLLRDRYFDENSRSDREYKGFMRNSLGILSSMVDCLEPKSIVAKHQAKKIKNMLAPWTEDSEEDTLQVAGSKRSRALIGK